MRRKKEIILFAMMILVIGGGLFLWNWNKGSAFTLSDSERFHQEYKEVPKENVYVYKTSDEILNILKHGTGIVYLGFPECPWCQRYTVYLNQVAKEKHLSKIYYYNIRKDREENNQTYKQLLSILEEYLGYDEEGNHRIYVPSIIAVKEGKLVGFDDETSYDTKNAKTPDAYWTEERIQNLKDKLAKMIKDATTQVCTDCNA